MSTIEDLNRAIQLAIDHVVEEYRQTVIVQAAQFPHDAPYGFDPEGWALFVIVDDENRLGSAKYVAVNMETGETKSMGRMGE
jgi:hypothetical protein